MDDIKERMTRLESMFEKVLDRVDRIGSDIRTIKEN